MSINAKDFVDLKLKEVTPYNHNTSTFVFELPNNEAALMPVASCIVISFSDAQGKKVVRPYTPISQPEEKGILTLLVKKYEQGNASKHIHSLKPGDTLAFKGPFPKWKYEPNQFEEVALIGGGSGITPLFQVINHALSNPDNKIKFTLLFSNVTEADILMKADFDALHKAHPDTLKLVYLLDTPPSGWAGLTGYINQEVIKSHVAPPTLGDKVKVFVCGPPPQVAAIAGPKTDRGEQGALTGLLKELGYAEDQVYKF